MEYKERAEGHPDIKEALTERFEEEIEDAEEYYELAEAHPSTAYAYYVLAREELSHANFFRSELHDRGFHLPEELEKKWHHVLKLLGFEK